MATYLYETIPSKPSGKSKRYEIRQSMKEAALKTHPETGEAIRRVVTGGFGLMGLSRAESAPAGSGHACCGSSCGCQ